jgi:uncharacterized SAM-binding protein YcdF (DUF218 family)
LRRALVALAILAVGLLLLYRPVLEAIPPRLVAQDEEETGDVIVVLAGDSGERVERACELWKKGRSRSGLLVCSGGRLYHTTTWASLMAAHARELGVPQERILEQGKSRTTVEDARYTIELLRDKDVKSIVLVTSAWHSRRAKRCFEREAPSIRIISCPSAAPRVEGDWWHDAEATRAIVTEVLKYLW